MLKSNLTFYLSFIFIVLFSISVLGQDGVPSFLLETEWLETKDQKKWDKLIEEHKEVDKLLSQSNELYLQADALAQESGADYEKNQKKVVKLENEAKDLYVEALEGYKDLYGSMLSVLESYIGEEEKQHAAYSEMIYFSDEATSLYKEVKKIETDTDKEKLTRANEMQLTSIEKGFSIFSTSTENYSNTQVTQENAVDNNDVVLDNELYQKYKEYISDSLIPDPIVVEQLMEMEGDDATLYAFKELLQQGSFDYDNNTQTSQGQPTDTSITAQTEQINSGQEEQQQVDQVQQSNAQHEFVGEQQESESLVKSAMEASNSREYASPMVGVQHEFRVQVAASKAPMSLSQLKAVYLGEYSILEYKEGNFYKYQIKGFRLFTDAQAVCSSSGVENAYIMAYMGASSVPLIEAVKEARNLEQEVKKVGRLKALQSIEFSVQVAASRVRLLQEQLESIYSGTYDISIIFEEGWYKYQILAGNDLKFALDALETCGVRKAFLVAYKNGKKIKLYKALNEYKTYLP